MAGPRRTRQVSIAVLAVQSWRRVRSGWLRRGHSLASMRPVAITAVAPLTLGSVAAVGHELGSAGRPPEVGSSIDGSSAAVTLPRDTTARRRPHRRRARDLGARDDRRLRLGSATSTGPRTGASGRMRPTGCSASTTARRCSRGPPRCSSPTPAPLSDLAVRDHHRSVRAALAPARFERAQAGFVTSASSPNQI